MSNLGNGECLDRFQIFSGIYPIDFANEQGYPPEVIVAMQDNTSNLSKMANYYPKEWSRFVFSNNYNKDDRNITDFAHNLIGGWLLQDYLITLLKNYGFEVSRNGSDSDRKLHPGSMTTHEADILVSTRDYKTIPIEIQQTNYADRKWFRYNDVPVKENKLSKLIKDKAFIIHIGTLAKQFKIIDLSKPQIIEVSTFGGAIKTVRKNYKDIKNTQDSTYDFSEKTFAIIVESYANNY